VKMGLNYEKGARITCPFHKIVESQKSILRKYIYADAVFIDNHREVHFLGS
jgi:hypothetical protein